MHHINKQDTPDFLSKYQLFTPLSEAITHITKRRLDVNLMARIRDYLRGDVPDYFDRDTPVVYLSRHIATPNFETLYFHELTKSLHLPMLVGQDSDGLFVAKNELKRALGKLPVVKGQAKDGSDIIQNFTIVDFSTAQGKPMSTIKTVFGVDLVSFHNELFRKLSECVDIEIIEEKAWIDRNSRDDIYEQYKRMLALMCVYGIMFESYPKNEQGFVEDTLLPAFTEVERALGCRPLIVEHINEQQEETKEWTAYPASLYDVIHDAVTEILPIGVESTNVMPVYKYER